MIKLLFISMTCCVCITAYSQAYVNESYYSGLDLNGVGYGNGYASESSGGVFYNSSFVSGPSDIAIYTSYNPTNESIGVTGNGRFSLDSLSAVLIGVNSQKFTGILGSNSIFNNSSVIEFSNITELNASNNAGVISYVRTIRPDWRIAGAVRILGAKIDGYGKMVGYGLDISVTKELRRTKLSLALNDVSVGKNKWTYTDPTQLPQTSNESISIISIEKSLPRFSLIGEYDIYSDSLNTSIHVLGVLNTTFDDRNSGLFRIGGTSSQFGLFIKGRYQSVYLALGVKDILTFNGVATNLGVNLGYQTKSYRIGYGFVQGFGYGIDTSIHSFGLMKLF